MRYRRVLKHLCNGTLSRRLQWERLKHVKLKRSNWWNSQIGKREYVETKIQHGVRVRLHFDSCLSQKIFRGDFEWRERQFLNDFLRPGDVFLDVGANIGLFTLIAAHRVGTSGRVFAFEPVPKTYQRLISNIELNHFENVSCHQLALSDIVGRLDMNISLDGFDAWNSLAQPTAGNSFTVETVDCVSLDAFAQKHKLFGRVTMMKIDVEGWESRVLSAGFELLSRSDAPLLQIEFNDQNCRSAGSSCQKLYYLLDKLGYKPFVYDAMSKTVIPETLRENHQGLNLIASKQPHVLFHRLASR
jgi:FkbM family methyltransferase